MALTDIDTIDQGPTQYVPGSHYSGRNPNDQDHPEFEGRGPHVDPYVRLGTSTSKIRNVGTVVRPTDRIEHVISYNRSTLHVGHIGALTCAIRFLSPKIICEPPMIAC